MLTGLPPFYDENTNEMYRKILQDPLQFPADIDRDAKSILTRLLDRDPARRLGSGGASEIKAHRFFETVDWKRLLQKKIQPTFRPNVVCLILPPRYLQLNINSSLGECHGYCQFRQRVYERSSYRLLCRRRLVEPVCSTAVHRLELQPPWSVGHG